MKRIIALLLCTYFFISCTEKPSGEIVFNEEGFVIFDWKKIVPGYSESFSHLYGFDKDPRGVNNPDYHKDVYVSVLEGEGAKVVLNLPGKSHKSYSLKKQGTEEVVGTWEASDEIEVELDAGSYELYGDGKNLDRNIYIFGQKWRDIEIEYYQFDGDSPCVDQNQCITKDAVQSAFNDIFSQALVRANFVSVDPVSKGIFGGLTFPLDKALGEGYSSIAQKLDVLERYHRDKKDFIAFFAVNSVNWQWMLNLNDFNLGFFRLSNYDRTNYQSRINEKIPIKLKTCFVPSTEVSGFLTLIDYEGNTGTVVLDGVENLVEAAHEKMPYISVDCAYLILASDKPTLPSRSRAAAVTIPGSLDQLYRPINFLAYTHIQDGGMQLTITTAVHELGHTLGLLDLYKDDGTYVISPDNHRLATTESDLMTYQQPNGTRLRFRPLYAHDVKAAENKVRTNKKTKQLVTDNQWSCLFDSNLCQWMVFSGLE